MLSRSFGVAIVMQTVICHSHVGQKSVLFVTDQPRSRRTVYVVVSTDLRELTEILFPTRNATAQPGRSWPRRREAFLPLAELYRMEGMLRASPHCRSHQGSIAARIVMVRQRGEGSELSLCCYLRRCDAIQRSDRRRDSHRHRIQSGRSREIEGSSFQPAVPSRHFSCGGPVKGRSGWASGEERWTAYDETLTTEREVLGKGVKGEDGRAAGWANLYRR
jgi:hypothetical protein